MLQQIEAMVRHVAPGPGQICNQVVIDLLARHSYNQVIFIGRQADSMKGNNSGVFKKDKTCRSCSLWYNGFCVKHKQATFTDGFCDNHKESKRKERSHG